MFRLVRRILAIALIARAAWWILVMWLGEPTYGFDEGRPTGLRIAPLTRFEAARARARERELARAMDILEDRTITALTGAD